MKGDNNKSLSHSEGFSEQKDYRVDPADFSILHTGGPRGQCKVGFIFWQSGRILNNGTVFIRSTIEQECKLVCGAKLQRHCPKTPIIAGNKGENIGEHRIMIPSDYGYLATFLLSMGFPVTGIILVHTNYDVMLGDFNDIFYCCASTLCFYMLSVSFDLLCDCLQRIPAILLPRLSGKPRNLKKYQKSIIWQDVLLGYYAISVGMTLWLQYHLYDLKNAAFVLECWFGLCLFHRILRSSGKREIKPSK